MSKKLDPSLNNNLSVPPDNKRTSVTDHADKDALCHEFADIHTYKYPD